MRPKWFLVLGLGFLGSAAVCAYAAWSMPKRGLICPKPVVRFSDLSQGQSVSAEFELHNTFGQGVRILGVRQSCGCTSVQLSARSLAPGERLEVRAMWATGGMRGESAVRIWVVYEQEGGRAGSTELRLEGDVKPDVEYSPASLTFSPAGEKWKEVRLTPGRLASFRVDRVYCTHRAFEATLKGDPRRAVVSFDPAEWPAGGLSEEAFLVVETDSKNQPALHIPLQVAVSDASRGE